MFWDDEKIRNFLVKHFDQKYIILYDSHTIFAQKADLARYTILYVYGGIYLDMDVLCRKNLTPFLQYDFFFTDANFFGMYKFYQNNIFGSRSKHPIFLFIFKNLFLRQNKSNSTFNVMYSTGPKLLYDSINEYKETTGKNDFRIVDKKYINPCNKFSGELCTYKCDECFAVDMGHNSWSPAIVKFYNKYIMKNLIMIIIIILLLIIFVIFIRFQKIKNN